MSSKARLSASVDADLIEAAEDAVARGQAHTVSAWVNEALRFKVDHDRRQQALARLIAEYEADHGEITEDEMESAVRRARARARTPRTLPTGGTTRRRRKG